MVWENLPSFSLLLSLYKVYFWNIEPFLKIVYNQME